MISFTVLTSDAAGVCLLGKKGFTGLRFATLVPWGGGWWRKKVSETKDDMVGGRKSRGTRQECQEIIRSYHFHQVNSKKLDFTSV